MSIAPKRSTPLVADGSRPRVHAPSRIPPVSSDSHANPSGRKRKSVTAVGSASGTGQTSGRVPTPQWRIQPTSARPHSRIGEEYNLDSLLHDPSKSLPRRNSSGSSLNDPHPTRRSASCLAATPTVMRPIKVLRWDGLTREASEWDGLRRDPELWFEDGDCLVHLYARGQSRRGAAFCVPFKVLQQSNCGSMLSLCFAQMKTTPGTTSSHLRQLSNGSNVSAFGSAKVELYIPAPDDASREAAFRWHITTRNFFAYTFGKPLVGDHLGSAFVDLQKRMQLFRSGQIDNSEDFFKYAEVQGYRDLVDSPDYALAMLYYTEHYKLRDLWIDAFAHCVGMNESLALSPEFAPLSRLTKALITRAYLEMDIHLGRVTGAVRNFLEDDLSPAHLGLPDGARAHLDRFRSFLHGFYVEKFGYWPPPAGSAFSKALFKSLYFDFRNLHNYLVDRESTTNIASQKPASGGICVLQNVTSFDQRHKFAPLPHPLPLLPLDVPVRRRTESQKALKTLTLGSKHEKIDRYLTARASLLSATNIDDPSVSSCAIVQAYVRFERLCAQNQREEKVSMADARKVRWLLIYGTLQYLASALRAPKQVRDTDSPKYPLCCLVTEQSPWQAGTKVLNSPLTPSINVPEAIDDFISQSNDITPRQNTLSASAIQPDCQNQDYFSHTNVDTNGASVSVEVPAPLRVLSPRGNSTCRSVRRLSLSTLSSRRNSVQLKSNPHCEILVQGYGNGLNDTHVDLPSIKSSVYPSSSVYSSQVPSRQSSLLVNDTDIHPSERLVLDLFADEPPRTPTLNTFYIEDVVTPVASMMPWVPASSSESTLSVDSPVWSDGDSSVSSKSSIYAGSIRKNCEAEDSGLLGGLVSFGEAPIPDIEKMSQPSSPINEFRFGFQRQSVSFPDLHQGSPADYHTDPAIGIAISAPMTPPEDAPRAIPMAALSFEDPPLKKLSFSHDPLRDNIIDIFYALDISSRPEKLGYEKPSRIRFSRTPSTRSSKKSPPPKIAPKTTDDEKSQPIVRRRSLFGLRV